MSQEITRALHSISVAKLYLEDFINEYPAYKTRANSWINRLSFVSLDALSILTQESRDIYRQQIVKGDPLLFEHVFQLLAKMTPEQRSLIEKSAEALLKGEIEIIES